MKPAVNVHPVANHYSSRDQRIIEYSHPKGGGGLISFEVVYPDGEPELRVHLYRHDASVRITVAEVAS